MFFEEMRQKSYVYLSYKSEFQNRRPRGCPPLHWKYQIIKDTGLPLLTAERYVKGKTRWKNCVDRSEGLLGYAVRSSQIKYVFLCIYMYIYIGPFRRGVQLHTHAPRHMQKCLDV